MNDLPDFDTVVQYIKTGLKRKTSLDQIRGVLSSNRIAMATIDRAVVVAIEQLDQGRGIQEKVKVEEIPVAAPETPRDEDKQGYKLAIIIIFVCFVVGTMLIASRFVPGANNLNEGLNQLGYAARGLFLNRDYSALCKESLKDLPSKDQFEICRIGSDYYDDYEVFRASNSKESVAKIITRVQEKCAALPESMRNICSEKTPDMLNDCYTKRAKANEYLLTGISTQ